MFTGRPCGRYVLVSAVTIAALARQFGLTVDQVTNELEAWALCAPATPTTHPPRRSIHPQCLQRAWLPLSPRLPLQVRARREAPAGRGAGT